MSCRAIDFLGLFNFDLVTNDIDIICLLETIQWQKSLTFTNDLGFKEISGKCTVCRPAEGFVWQRSAVLVRARGATSNSRRDANQLRYALGLELNLLQIFLRSEEKDLKENWQGRTLQSRATDWKKRTVLWTAALWNRPMRNIQDTNKLKRAERNQFFCQEHFFHAQAIITRVTIFIWGSISENASDDRRDAKSIHVLVTYSIHSKAKRNVSTAC